jgi:histidinol phosphatase-like PHP family hydrolase
MHNLHSHTTLSDGELAPMELMRRFAAAGYATIGVTDHVGAGGMERIISEVAEDAQVASRGFGIVVLPGVELTHIPPSEVARLARRARAAGAKIVVVHGETLVEPTAPGTNIAAAACSDVDILAHPGLIDREVARAARENGVYLEVSARKGHCLTNGHVARIARDEGAPLIFGLDAHGPGDIVTADMRDRLLLGAGLDCSEAEAAAVGAPLMLRARAGL